MTIFTASKSTGRHIFYVFICYTLAMTFSIGYLYQRNVLYFIKDVKPSEPQPTTLTTLRTLAVENETYNFYTNKVKCKKMAEINKINLPKDSILHHITDEVLNYRSTPREYPTCDLITPWDLFNSSGGNTPNWILILVKSAPQNLRRRTVIRETWGSLRAIKGRKIFTVFVVAKAGDDLAKQTALEQENKVYGDLLQCDFQDSYVNLPLKVLSMMGWALSYSVSTKFVMITDDDVALKWPTVNGFFVDKEPLWKEKHAYCGFRFSLKSGPLRNTKSKWYMPPDIYPGTKYPIFCNGPNYSMTKSLMHDLFCTASMTDYDGFYLEDVLITGIIRAKLNSDKENIHPGGGFIQYFWSQKGGVENMIRQTWNKWKQTDAALKTILSAEDTVIEPSNKDVQNVVGIEKFWDGV